MQRHSAAFAILVGGLIAGTLDITYAIVYSGMHGVSATRVLQSVASGLLGKSSYDGGVPTAALGLALHYFIALCATAIFYAASRHLQFLTRRAVISGLIYGAIIYAVMNLIVLPLSAYTGKPNFEPAILALNLFVHMVFIGLPMALATRRATVNA